MNLRCSRPLRSRRAFTVIELLVAISVTAVLVTLMVTITLNVLNAWNRSSGRLTANATARLVLDQLAQDLSGAIMRRDGKVWLAATVQRDQNVTTSGDTGMSSAYWAVPPAWTNGKTKPLATQGSLKLTGSDVATIADYRFGQAGVWLRFFSAPPAENSGDLDKTSTPRAISWQIVRRQLGATLATSQFSYHLFRSEVRPFDSSTSVAGDNVFSVGYDLYMDPGAAISYNNGNAVMDGNVGNVRRPHANQLIGVDVIDFGVKFYERNNAGNLVETFPGTPPSAPFSYAATSDASKSLANTGTSTYGFPEEAEIMVRVLTTEGARLIAAFEEGNLQRDAAQFTSDDAFWWDIAEKHSIVFTRRVAIQPKVL